MFKIYFDVFFDELEDLVGKFQSKKGLRGVLFEMVGICHQIETSHRIPISIAVC